jgi:predicted CxxxxCH...CXXCH cytochrome family protein
MSARSHGAILSPAVTPAQGAVMLPPLIDVTTAAGTASETPVLTAGGFVRRSRRVRVLGALALGVLSGCNVARPLQGSGRYSCEHCHLSPPATGAHLRHAGGSDRATLAYGTLVLSEDLGPSSSASYAFGCGHCHPLDPSKHMNGRTDVELAPAPGAGGSLRALNDPTAAYDRAARTCAGAYCHSSGQATPMFVTTPAWDAVAGSLGCGGCHGEPPRYASAGPDSSSANSHLVFADDAWESGHFAGLPGPWHGSKHGGAWAGQRASPITCQTCHYESVASGASFYWLRTTGDYQLPGGDPARLASQTYLDLRCSTCHADGGIAAAGAEGAAPFRHVNGRRDVVFDPRSTVDPLSWLPPPPNTPTRPIWVTDGAPGIAFPDPAIPDAGLDGTTLSMTLAGARYDADTRTCTSVACHLQQTTVRWGAPHGWVACSSCHTF